MTNQILAELEKQTAAIERIEGLLIDVIASHMGGYATIRENYKQLRNGRRARHGGGTHTRKEWEALKRKYGYRCLRCDRPEPDIRLTRDHIDPRGSNDIENIQPLCEACNNWKGDQVIDFRPKE